jgi:hypothetical protein
VLGAHTNYLPRAFFPPSNTLVVNQRIRTMYAVLESFRHFGSYSNELQTIMIELNEVLP